MRIFLVASLLFSGSIAFVESAPEIPASFHDALQSYSAKRDEFLQYSNEQVLHRVLTQIQSADASNRDLQATAAPTSPSLCNADQTVNFDDDFSLIAFGSDFNPTCSCSEDTNQMEVTVGLQDLFLNLTDSFADDFNTLFATLYSDMAYTCTNGCESCYDGVCGLLETTSESSVSYNKPNFTTDQIFNRQIDPTPFIANFTFLVMNCVQYTSGATSNGQLCFGVDIDNPADVTSAGQICMLEYDGVACNTCVVDLTGPNGCYVADCTNIDASASIDSCAVTGYVGPFVFLGILRSDNFNATDLTLGSCDAPSAPVAAVPTANPTESPLDTPTESPLDTPTESPLDTPTESPLTLPTEKPTKEPTPSSGLSTSSPTLSSVVASKSTNAPAPIKSPAITAAPSEDSRGSSVGVALGSAAIGIVILAVIGHFVLQRKKPSSTLPVEAQPIDNAPSLSTSYTVPMASVLPISTSVEGLVPPAVSYKDQAREHADAAGVPVAVALSRRSDGAHPIKAEPPGIRHDIEHMDGASS